MNEQSLFKRLFYRFTAYFTAVFAVMLLGALFVYGDTENAVLQVGRVAFFFPCALALALAEELLYLNRPPLWGKIILHAAAVFFALFLFLWLPAGKGILKGFILLAIYVPLYFLGWLLLRFFWLLQTPKKESKT